MNAELTPCMPSVSHLVCPTCTRYTSRKPVVRIRTDHGKRTESQIGLVIDGSVVWRDGVCPMYAERHVERPFCEPREVEAA
jgi:hypothetical protein